MSPIQQMLLGVGAVATKTYVDDIFSTFVYTGNSTARSINNGIDFGKGAMVWTKTRSAAYHHNLFDTVRTNGRTHSLASSSDIGEGNYGTDGITSFNSNGFSLGTDTQGALNDNNKTYASWTFRKAPGFFDVVTYTGNGTAGRTVSHSLGSVPGMVIIKKVNESENWNVWHRSLPLRDGYDYTRQKLNLNTGTPAANLGGNTTWNDTQPSATNITLGTNSEVNQNNGEYVAYFLAGGESTQSEAVSVDFDGNDSLTSATSSDLSFGTGDYTVEFWFNADAIGDTPLFENRVSGSSSDATGFTLTAHGSSNGVRIWWTGASRINGGGSSLELKQWHHLAATRSSGTTYLFLDGTLLGTTTDSINITTTEAHIAGGKYSGGSSLSHYFNGKISNFRIVKGTAVYTSSFRPTYKPLTNITNTKLLCCNNSSTTGKTVGPTITANGDPTASTDSPFDDPAGFVFGDAEDQNVIKCGSYVGNGSTDGPEINLGFEPQWILFRNIQENGDEWVMFDSMRGIVSGGNDIRLNANTNNAEYTNLDQVDITPTGFKITSEYSMVNRVDNQLIYVAIRRPDGYVGKPVELGTGVFAMDTGSNSATIPTFDSGFPVDFAFQKLYASSEDWYTSARLMQGKYFFTNTNDAQSSSGNMVFDSNAGWALDSSSTYQSWMWKRHAGFDVVAYTGNGTSGHSINHSLGTKSPEMIWIKRRDTSGNAGDWMVGHKGLNGGSSPWNEYLVLNKDQGEMSDNNPFNNVAPTTTAFQLSDWDRVNANNSTYIAMLFSSVDGISKVGSYTGNGSARSISLNFSPRFIIIKNASGGGNWFVYDTLRGWPTSGNAPYLLIDTTASQTTGTNYINATSTGFSLPGSALNSSSGGGATYIYYAHA